MILEYPWTTFEQKKILEDVILDSSLAFFRNFFQKMIQK